MQIVERTITKSLQPSGKSNEINKIKTFARWSFPVCFLMLFVLYLMHQPLYLALTVEDGLVEWLTFSLLFLSGGVLAANAVNIRRIHGYNAWYFILFSCFALIAAGEEISWGQRIFDVKTTAFFQANSDQHENNIHNAFQKIVGIKTKHIALLVLFIWGVVLPVLYKKGKLNRAFFGPKTIIIPPTFLIPAFLLSTFCMLDFPTEQEEEFGECFYSLIFLIFAVYHHTLIRRDRLKLEC